LGREPLSEEYFWAFTTESEQALSDARAAVREQKRGLILGKNRGLLARR
jgi:hypothetical protein